MGVDWMFYKYIQEYYNKIQLLKQLMTRNQLGHADCCSHSKVENKIPGFINSGRYQQATYWYHGTYNYPHPKMLTDKHDNSGNTQ